MKTALIAMAAAFFLVAVPVHAQDRASQLSFSGGGGGMGGGSGFGSSSINGGSSFLPTADRTEHYTYIYAQGSDATYIPTRFVSFATGLKIAKEMLADRPKSLGEIAAEYRAEKKQTK